MPIQFDPIAKYILVTSPTTALTALEIYSAAMDWCDDQPTMGYTIPMEAVGKFDMGGGVYSDSIFLLKNGWKIKFWSGTYQATITGTLLPEPGQSRTVPPDSGNVEVVFQVSSQGTVIPDIAEWTQTEKNGIINDIDLIEAKTMPLPSDPASESTLATIKAKTENLPIDPADQSLIDAKIEEKTSEVQGTGFQKDVDSLKQIKEYVDELEAGLILGSPQSIGQVLEKKLRTG